MDPHELEEYIQREFERLPLPAAPSSLLPRVLDLARPSRVRPWHVQRWFEWPASWQGAAATAAILAVLVLSRWIGAIQAELPVIYTLSDQVAQVIEVMHHLPVIEHLIVLLFLIMLGTSVAFGAGIQHLARGGARS